jgi:hypothetical protein
MRIGGDPGPGQPGIRLGDSWRRHSSLRFGLWCFAAKLATEAAGLSWTGLRGLIGASGPTWDVLAFFPACVVVFEVLDWIPGAARLAGLVLAAAAVAATTTADLLSLEFFHSHFTSVLPVLLRTHALSATGSNLSKLVPVGVGTMIAVSAVGAVVLFRRRTEVRSRMIWPAALVLLAFAATAHREEVLDDSLLRISGGSLYYSERVGEHMAEKPLASTRHLAPEERAPAPFEPSTILVFINESLPGHFASSASPDKTLFEALLGESGLPESGWFRFSRAFANSSTTDISMPSIMTGTDPTAGTDMAQRLPFLYDMAKRRGYDSGFFTSQDYGWARMRTFFESDSLDLLLSGEKTGQPNANLLGVDDMYVAQKVAEYVRRKGPNGKLLLVLNNNALHVPYQIESMIHVPGYAHDAKIRAAYIIEQFYAEIFKSLRDEGRLAGSLIFVTSDHGESHPDRKRDVIRLDSHFDEVIHVPFAVYLPESAPAAFRSALSANRDRTVANMDIAPTIMEALGLGLPQGLRYPGYSLFGPVPGARISVSVSNNEWRPWNVNSFGIASGDDRLLYHPKLGLCYFDVVKDPAEANPIRGGAKFESYRAYVMVHPTLPMWLNGAESH